MCFIYISHNLVWYQDSKNITAFNGFFNRQASEIFYVDPRLTSISKPYTHIYAAVLQVQRVGVALRTEADHGHGFTLEDTQIRVFVMIYFCCHGFR